MISSDDGHRRRQAWISLSNLFLDTELDDRDLERIASELKATGLSVDEIEWAYEFEVAPACRRNHAQPAGVWSGFDEAALIAKIENSSRASRGEDHAPSLWQRLKVRSWTSTTRDDWLRLRRMLTDPA